MKLLVLLAVVAGLWWLRRLAQVGRLARQLRQMRQVSREAPPRPAPQPMLRCLVCGTQTPASEALQDARGAYCCAAHQAKAAQDASSRTGERKE